MVREPDLQSKRTQMNASTFVDEAREMSLSLENRQNSELKDLPEARRQVAMMTGVCVSMLYSLRYRPPKTVGADVYNRLCAAIERRALTQIRTAHHEISTARSRRLGASDGALDLALREADILLAKARELLKDG